MIRAAVLTFIIILISATVSFSEEAHQLERIVVTPSRIASSISDSSRPVTIIDKNSVASSPYDAIQDILSNLGGIDVRRRGAEGIQSDINIRGTTFEQNTVLIDGIKINDPQTGHFNMDIPITRLDFEKAEVITGPASSLYGPNSFGGVINIITKKPSDEVIAADIEGGSFDFFSGALSATCPGHCEEPFLV